MKFAPQFELTVYQPRSVDPTESTALTPAAGASHADPFVVTTVQGLAGTRPYLGIPSARTGSIDPLNKKTTGGTIKLALLDSRVTPGGSNAARWVTAFVGDGKGGNILNGRKIRVRWRPDATAAWEVYWTGRISSVNLSGKLAVELTCSDASKDLDAEIFVGAPHSSITYAQLMPVSPIGLLDGYGPSSILPRTTPLKATVGAFPSVVVGKPFFVLTVDLSNGDPYRMLISNALMAAHRAGSQGWSGDMSARQPLLKVKVGGVWKTYGFSGLVGLIPTTSVQALSGYPLPGGDAMPANGAVVDCYVVPDAEPTDDSPLLIDTADVLQYIQDLAAGKFGRLDATGAPIRAVAVNAASFAAVAATATFPIPWRKPATKKRKLFEEIEEVCRAYFLNYYQNESGELCVVNPRRSATTTAGAALTDDDLAESTLAWQQSAEDAVTALSASIVIESYVTDSGIGVEPNKPLDPGYGRPRSHEADEFPKIPAGRISESTHQILVPMVAPRSGDVKPSTLSFDVTGLRVAVASAANGLSFEKGPAGQSRLTEIANHLSAIGADVFGPYGMGPSTIDVVCRRSSEAAKTVQRGMFVALTFSTLPDPATNLRGGPRLGLCLSRTDDGPTIKLKFLDAGANAVALAPVLGGLTAAEENNMVAVLVPVTLNAANEHVRLSYALTATDVAVRPDEDSGLWITSQLVTATSTVAVVGLPYGMRVWIRARSEPSAGQGFKLPSAYSFPTGTGRVDVAALPAPSAIAVAGPSAGALVASWTNGAAWAEVEILLAEGAAPAAWTDDDVIASLPAGSIQYPIGVQLQPLTNYTIGVRHRDPQLGVSAVAVLNFTAAAATVLAAPESPDGFSRRGSPLGNAAAQLLRTSYGRIYGLGVRATVFPCDVEFAEAIETAPLSGVYGAYSTVAKVRAVETDWTTWGRQIAFDGKKRKLKARQVRDGSTSSAYTVEVIVDPSVDDPINTYPSGNLFVRGVNTLTDVAPGGTFDGDMNVTGGGNFGEPIIAPNFILGAGDGGVPGDPGSPVSIQDEGVELTPDVTSINFVGPGVVASHVGSAVTITVAPSFASLSGIPTTIAGYGFTVDFHTQGDARWGQLGAANTWAGAQTINANLFINGALTNSLVGAGHIVLTNNRYLWGGNAAGTINRALIGLDPSNLVLIDGAGVGSIFGGAASFGGLVTSTYGLFDAAGGDGSGYRINGAAALVKTGNYLSMYGPGAAGGNVIIGNATDPSNYYDNNAHYFRNRAGTAYSYMTSDGRWEHYGAYSTFRSWLLSTDGTETNYRWQATLAGTDNFHLYSRSFGDVMVVNYTTAAVTFGGSLSAGAGSFAPGGDALIALTTWSADSHYNFLSLNGSGSATSGIGMFAGKTSIPNLYFQVPSGGFFSFRAPGTTEIARIDATAIASAYLIRATGWYGSGAGSSLSGLGLEIGISSGTGIVEAYNRDTSSYANIQIHGLDILLEQESYGVAFYSLSNVGWAMNSAMTAGRLEFRDASSTSKGYVYWDGVGFGLLNSGGNWSVLGYPGGARAGGVLYGMWQLDSVTAGYGVMIASRQFHVAENSWFDGSSWYALDGLARGGSGKGAIIQTYTEGGYALYLQADNTSRAGGTARSFSVVFTVSMTGAVQSAGAMTAPNFILG